MIKAAPPGIAPPATTRAFPKKTPLPPCDDLLRFPDDARLIRPAGMSGIALLFLEARHPSPFTAS